MLQNVGVAAVSEVEYVPGPGLRAVRINDARVRTYAHMVSAWPNGRTAPWCVRSCDARRRAGPCRPVTARRGSSAGRPHSSPHAAASSPARSSTVSSPRW